MATANSHTSLLLLLLLALVALTPSTTAASPNLDLKLHQLLQLLGFPPSLIPEPVEESLASLLPPAFSFTSASPLKNSYSDILHRVLQIFGFPPGLIPEPVEYFTASLARLCPLTVSFIIYFKEPCYVTYVYPNYFAPVFTGKITFGKISEMRGHKDQLPSTGEWTDMYDVIAVGDKLVFRFATDIVVYNRTQFEEVKTCEYGPLIPDNSNELISQLSKISAE